MDAEYFTVDDRSNAEVVKDISAVLPWIRVAIFAHGLIIEAVDSCDLAGLVVASKQSYVVWVLHLETQQQLECLY